jgi:hypothetical protein
MEDVRSHSECDNHRARGTAREARHIDMLCYMGVGNVDRQRIARRNRQLARNQGRLSETSITLNLSQNRLQVLLQPFVGRDEHRQPILLDHAKRSQPRRNVVPA